MILDTKKMILSEYTYKTEMHAHSLPISTCSEFYAQQLIRAYAKTGVHAIALTNHFTPTHLEGCSKEEFVEAYIAAYRTFKEYAEAEGIAPIFGIELRFRENFNDYLVFGIDEADAYRICDYLELGLERFCREFKRDGVVVIQAHPKRDKMTDMPMGLVDGWEAFNMHPGHNSRPALAARAANAEGLLITGGTDFHHPTHEACCLLRSRVPVKNSHDLAALLRSCDYVLDIGGSIILP